MATHNGLDKYKNNIGCVVLSWINLGDLGITEEDRNVQSFHDEQLAFFQTFQAKPSGYKPQHYVYAIPDLKTLKKTIQTMSQLQDPLRLIVNGVFMQFSSTSTHLITPLIHCMELLFNETNQFAASRMLKVCLWMLSIYETLQIPFFCNQCVCGTIQSHRKQDHLQISFRQSFIEHHCYKNHINPFKILLHNLHPEQRKCSALDISELARRMLSNLNISESLSTLEIEVQFQDDDKMEHWCCASCTFINSGHEITCLICGSYRNGAHVDESEYTLLNNKDAEKYKQNVLEQVANTDVCRIVCSNFGLKTKMETYTEVELRALLRFGVRWIDILMKDKHKRIICKIDRDELLSYDPQFSILQYCDEGDVNDMYDIYRLFVLYYEARQEINHALLRCKIFQRVAMRNYLGLIGDYVFGVDFPNDDVYNKNMRRLYCKTHLQQYATGQERKHNDFFSYWMSKYCLTDTDFLAFYAKSYSLQKMKLFCNDKPQLNALLLRFVSDCNEEEHDWIFDTDDPWYGD